MFYYTLFFGRSQGGECCFGGDRREGRGGVSVRGLRCGFGRGNSETAFIKSQIIDKFVTMELFGRLQKVAEKRQKNRYLII